MTNEDLLKEKDRIIADQSFRIEQLEHQIANLNKLIFGAKRERFIGSTSPDQATLFDMEVIGSSATEVVEKIVKQTKKRKAPKTFKRNEFPAELEREVTTIEPEGINNDWKKIGEDQTEILAYEPAKLKVLKTLRPKYIHKW